MIIVKNLFILLSLYVSTTLFANDVLKVASINDHLKDKTHPTTGILFELVRTTHHELGAIEIVVPRFHSYLDIQLPDELYMASDHERRPFLSKALAEAVEEDPLLASHFSPEQLILIKNRKPIKGYTWHDDAPVGKMQLVDSELHRKTGHTGGRWIWGGGTSNRQ